MTPARAAGRIHAGLLLASLVALLALGALGWLLLRPPPGPAAAKNFPVSPGTVSNDTLTAQGRNPGVAPPVPVSPAGSPGASNPAPGAARAAPSLAGIVLDKATRKPLERARVAARAAGGHVRGVETDAQGRFAFHGLPEGRYDVVGVAEGYLVPDPVTLATGPTASAEIVLERGLSIRGRVQDEEGKAPAGQVAIDLDGVDNMRFAGAFKPLLAGRDGTFEVIGVPAGSGYKVRARMPGRSPAFADVPPVAPPDGVSGLVVTLRAYAIAGVVTGVPEGQKASVSATQGDGLQTIETDGAFVIPVQGPGRYIVRARCGERGAPPRPVDVGTDPPRAEIVLALAPLRPVEGRVLDPERKPLAGASVLLAGTNGTEGEGTVTDAEGRFRIGAFAEAAYVLIARHAGFRDGMAQAEAGGAPVEVVLERLGPPVALRGRFRGAGGKPLEGTVVTFDAAEGSSGAREGRVGADGGLDLGAIDSGRYDVSFPEPAAGEIRAWLREVTVAPGEAAEVSFEEKAPRGSIAGRVAGMPAGELVGVRIRPAAKPKTAFGFMAATEVAADGTFRFAAVPPGRYLAVAQAGDRVAEAFVEVVSGAAASLTLDLR